MSRDIFLHEFIDIVGLGAWPYMEHTATCSGEQANGLELLGTWYTMGLTGRWSQCVNIWELPGGWEGWRDSIDRLGLKRKANKDLTGWWNEALNYRTGGFDRQLAGIPGCPTMATLERDGVRGTAFVHELSEVRPGAALEYLQAMQEEWVPVMHDYGLRPVGLYEVLMSDSEACSIWAGDVEGIVRLGRAYDAARGLDAEEFADERVLRWRNRAREYTTKFREELMTPCPGTICCPSE